MHISDVLRVKGREVVTVPPDTIVRDLLDLLAEFGIGAAVVSADGERVDGIVSERDVVRALAARGSVILTEEVAGLMTRDVVVVKLEDNVDQLFALMTEQRVRHIPVLVDGKLAGLVSIGDLVKARMSDLESERDSLAQYIHAATS
jgi:CBS domain-containing protein